MRRNQNNEKDPSGASSGYKTQKIGREGGEKERKREKQIYLEVIIYLLTPTSI